MTNLKTKINKIMTQRKISATDIEKATGLSRNTVTSILNGNSKNPGILTIQQLAKALNVKVESLISDEKEIQLDILEPDQIKLFAEVTTLIANIILEKNIRLSMHKISSIIQEVYDCAFKGKSLEVQKHFAEYLIDNHM
ncbi:MAG TPA: helix-turn-helix transcriptional regulator [Rickettsia endosymbiont of Omalisus fontisbellaquei]|nr:helix-turn-helix transcriptional regulator [Rickettsia endosymbiont of Omalisus fontisbellaquei]